MNSREFDTIIRDAQVTARDAASQLKDADDAIQRRIQYEQDRDDAIFETAAFLKELNAKIEQERQERLDSEQRAIKENKKQQAVDQKRFCWNIVIGSISALAAVVAAIVSVFTLVK